MSWHPTVAAAAGELESALAEVDPERLGQAVGKAALDRYAKFLSGIRRYRGHPYRRPPRDVPIAWQAGSARLLAYPGGSGLPLFVVPSLVNRSYILDLMKGRSLMRHLADAGFRPFLLDWGAPDDEERHFSLDDYFRHRLLPAFEAMLNEAGGPAGVIGYCLGGTLSLPLVQQAQASVAGLALLATPWDFHAVRADFAETTAAMLAAWLPAFEQMGEMPTDALQTLFASLDPHLALRKFSAFADLDPDSDRARHFVALEDWLNDGVPLATPVARECLIGWYGDNGPARGKWRVDGETVDPAQIDVPALALMPQRDRIVPLDSSRRLAELLPRCSQIVPDAGHIGMVTGSRARTEVWAPMVDWLKTLAE